MGKKKIFEVFVLMIFFVNLCRKLKVIQIFS